MSSWLSLRKEYFFMTSQAPSEQCATDSLSAHWPAAYAELCTSYRAIDDFRAKLLGFLPLATGGVIFLVAGNEDSLFKVNSDLLLPIGLFGGLVTFGLLIYELFGIRRCHAAIAAGRLIEEKLKISGQFSTRPDTALGALNEPVATAVIYPAVLAAWVYVILAKDFNSWALIAALLTFGIVCVAILEYARRLRNHATDEYSRVKTITDNLGQLHIELL
jgi:hypothetical protein